ncbi:MAG: GH3 auxin-responsive promoter, partial [Pricia sp.]
MPIIGNIIKGFIDVRDKLADETNPVDSQLEVLERLLKTAKDTAFGQQYDFEAILGSENPTKAFA